MGGLDIMQWAIVAIVIYGAYKAMHGRAGKISADGSKVCPHCGTRGESQTITQGSTAIELILWLCFIIPGLIYSLWRLTTRNQACPSCGQTGMIPVNSPNGRRLILRD